MFWVALYFGANLLLTLATLVSVYDTIRFQKSKEIIIGLVGMLIFAFPLFLLEIILGIGRRK